MQVRARTKSALQPQVTDLRNPTAALNVVPRTSRSPGSCYLFEENRPEREIPKQADLTEKVRVPRRRPCFVLALTPDGR